MQNNRMLPFVISVLMHGGIILALIVAAPIATYRLTSNSTQPIVHASMVQTLEVKPVPTPPVATPVPEEKPPAPPPPQKAPQEIQKKATTPPPIKIEKTEKIEKKRVQQQKIIEEELQRAKLKEQQAQAAAAAAALEKKNLERKKQEEALQAKALAEKKQLEEEEKKLQAAVLAEKQAALQQQLLQQQLINEQQQVVQAQQIQGIIDQYRTRILIAIRNQWLMPGIMERNLSCMFAIDLTPEGVVSRVQLIRSSGNAALDRSAEIAIYKASPLPVPKDPAAFAPFRHLTLTMAPQETLN